MQKADRLCDIAEGFHRIPMPYQQKYQELLRGIVLYIDELEDPKKHTKRDLASLKHVAWRLKKIVTDVDGD
jgi:hypothetical protein